MLTSRRFALSCVLLLCAQTNIMAQVGTPLPLFDGGMVDGWSGLSVLYAEAMPAGETVDTVQYYAADVRDLGIEDGLYSFVPLIVKQEGGSRQSGDGTFTIHEVGPVHIPEEAGENLLTWGSSPIPDDNNLYHPAFVAWQDGVDDTDGGLVSFAGSGGTGMVQFNVDTTFFAPDDLGEIEPGFELNPLETHRSIYGGRQYQLNFGMSNCTEICEPFEPPPPPPPQTGIVGTPPELRNGGTVDSWSGIATMFGAQINPGETVEVVNYYTADDRATAVEDELYSVVPIIVRQEDGSVEDGLGLFSIFEIGPLQTPNEPGENSIEWGSMEIPDDGNLYHPAMLQWQQDVDDSNGGVISFAANGGTGMHFFNVDTTFYPDDLDELEPDFVLSDLQTHTSNFDGRQYQFNFVTSAFNPGEPCDLNGDGACDATDIDDLSALIEGGQFDADFDVNGDGKLDNVDREEWVHNLMNTHFGDANLDMEFNSGDLVDVFIGSKYDSDTPAGWALGDWDGDGLFNSSDLVAAFSDSGYVAAATAVPEPSTLVALVLGILTCLLVRRRQ